jgi:hypothetical protein
MEDKATIPALQIETQRKVERLEELKKSLLQRAFNGGL